MLLSYCLSAIGVLIHFFEPIQFRSIQVSRTGCVLRLVYIISIDMLTNNSVSVNPYHFRIIVIPKVNLRCWIIKREEYNEFLERSVSFTEDTHYG